MNQKKSQKNTLFLSLGLVLLTVGILAFIKFSGSKSTALTSPYDFTAPEIAEKSPEGSPVAESIVGDITISGSGEVTINETIKVGGLASIVRTLPYKTRTGRNIGLENITALDERGNPLRIESEKKDGNLVLKIGIPLSGSESIGEFKLGYTLTNAISPSAEGDSFYWFSKDYGWQSKAGLAKSKIHFPKGTELEKITAECWTGKFGSTDKNCQIATDPTNKTISFAPTKDLGAKEGLAFVIRMPAFSSRPSL